MKINYLFVAIIVAALAFSCQKSDENLTNEPRIQNESSSENSATPSLNKDEHGEFVLSFGSEVEMNAQIHNLKQMAVNAGTDMFYEQFEGFTSQSRYMWNVVDELNNAHSIEEVYEIQKSNEGLLVFNDNKADEDISPYIPTTRLGTDLVCNKYGNVMIGGKIKNFNNIQSYSELQDAKSQGVTRAHDVTYINGTGRVEYDKRRFWVEAWQNNGTGWIELKMTAHAKNIFGWNKYQTVYSLRFDYFQGYASITDVCAFILSQRPGYAVTKEIPAETFIPLVKGISFSYNYAKFTMTAQSRGVPKPTSFRVYTYR